MAQPASGYPCAMSLFSTVSRLARSPQGKKALDQAKRLASDPKNREKLDGLRKRFAEKRSEPSRRK